MLAGAPPLRLAPTSPRLLAVSLNSSCSKVAAAAPRALLNDARLGDDRARATSFCLALFAARQNESVCIHSKSGRIALPTECRSPRSPRSRGGLFRGVAGRGATPRHAPGVAGHGWAWRGQRAIHHALGWGGSWGEGEGSFLPFRPRMWRWIKKLALVRWHPHGYRTRT